MVPLLVVRAANEKQFIRETAKRVLETVVNECAGHALVATLLQIGIRERKQAQVMTLAGVYAHKALEAQTHAQLAQYFEHQSELFFTHMLPFLQCRVVECKNATKQSLVFMRRIVGVSCRLIVV